MTASLPQSAVKGFHSGSVLAAAAAEEDDARQQQDATAIAMPNQHQLTMTDQTDEYLQSRADAMQNIETTIVELGGIFQQLAHMIKEQVTSFSRRVGNRIEKLNLLAGRDHGSH